MSEPKWVVVRGLNAYGYRNIGAVHSIRATYYPCKEGRRQLRIRITLEADVGTVVPGECGLCGAKVPADLTTDQLLYIYEHHDTQRLLFPHGEEEEAERDSYPVPGWSGLGKRLRCPACQKAEAEALATVRVDRQGLRGGGR